MSRRGPGTRQASVRQGGEDKEVSAGARDNTGRCGAVGVVFGLGGGAVRGGGTERAGDGPVADELASAEGRRKGWRGCLSPLPVG